MINVLLVDDHAFVLKSLKYLIHTTDDIQVGATAANGVEAVSQASLHCPNVAVLDISMPLMNGIEAARQILVLCPLTRVMMISTFDTPEYIHQALDVGALGYVLKDEASNDLLSCIRALSSGTHFFSQRISGMAENYLRQKGSDNRVVPIK